MAALSPETYNKSGTKATTGVKLNKDVFGVACENFELIKLAYLSYLANGRENLAKTKTRGLVSGGGKKPHKQKGTGRARSGSIRNPIWRGGGIIFGPTGEENYKIKLSTGSKRKATRQALSMAAEDGKVKIIEAFESKDGKLKPAATLLKKIGANGNILIAVTQLSDNLDRSTRNLPDVKTVYAQNLNVFDIVNADVLLLEKGSLDVIDKWLGGKK